MAHRDNVGSNVLVAAAIVCGALILNWRSPTSEPRYQLAASGSAIVRLDTESGALIACDLQTCHQLEAPASAQTGNPITNVFNNVRSKVAQEEIEERAKK